jgi:gluconokinase
MTSNYIIMGVSGSGKTTVGLALASLLDLHFIDGDDLHPPANKDKMAKGIALQDEDRQPWLETIRDTLQQSEGIVIACSSLKRVYRDTLRQGNSGLKFIYLQGDKATLKERLEQRSGHFMKANMLDSQLATFEIPVNEKDVIFVDINQSVDQQILMIRKAID